MEEELRASGLDVLGDVPWGTHFCQFYKTKADLIDLLVPYFQAGLAHNECCMWVTSQPLGVEDAKASLKKVVQDLDRYMESGQIEILDYRQWYTQGGAFEAHRVLEGWVQKERHAVARGFDGLRLTGNTFWLEKSDWEAFRDYEAAIDHVIGAHRIIALCSYCLDRCGASEIIDVVGNHRFALIRREGKWKRIESAERKQTEDALRKSRQLVQRTFAGLRDALFIIDADTVEIIDCNPAASEIFGYSRQEMIGRTTSFLHVDEAALEEFRGYLYPAVEEKGFLFLPDFRMKRKDGTIFSTEHSVVPLEDGQSQRIGWVSVVRDITERKQAEQALRRSAALDRMRAEVFRMKSASDIHSVLTAIYRELQALGVGFNDCSINLLKEGTEPPEFEAYCISSERVWAIGAPSGSEQIGKMWRMGEPVYRSDLDREDGYGERGYMDGIWEKRIRSVVDVPFSKGTLAINSVEPDAFSEEDIELLKGFAGVLSEGYTRVEDLERIEESGKALRESEERFRTIFESSLIGISIANAEGRFLQTNRAFEEMVGYTEDELRSMTFGDLTYPDDLDEDLRLFRETQEGKRNHYRVQKRYCRKDGRVVWGDLAASVVRDANGGFLYSFAMVEDITRRKQAEQQLAHMATHDPLTGLPNRTLFDDRLGLQLAHADRNRQRLAVMLLDLDNFKEVNDTLGHSVGDQVLQAIGKRLMSALRKSDTVARMGGDEFMVLLPSLAREQDANRIAQHLQNAIREPFVLDNRTWCVTTSIGIVVYPDDGGDANTLMKHADIAMYRAKRQGRNNVQRYFSDED